MGIRTKVKNFLKETWEGIMSPGPVERPNARHRIGYGSLHRDLTGTNMPAAYDRKPERHL